MNTTRVKFGEALPKPHFFIYRIGQPTAAGFESHGYVDVREAPGHKPLGCYANVDEAIRAAESAGGTWEVFPKHVQVDVHQVSDD